MRLAVVMASLLRFPAGRRTGACLLHEAHRRGHRIWCLPPEAISEEGGELVGLAHDAAVPPTADVETFWRRLQARMDARPPVRLALETLEAILWRKDPPLHREAAKRLARLAGTIPCLNDPRALLRWASKASVLKRLGHLMPPSAVVTSPEELRGAAASITGAVIVKPLEGKGGGGVIRVAAGDRSRLADRVAAEPALAESLTAGPGVLLQQEVHGPLPGDVRILCLDGRMLGAMRRIPRAGEFRANVAQGARVAPAKLAAADRARWEAVARELADEGLALVGLDVVGPWLIEVNVVTPAGIPRLNALVGRRLERDVLEWLERAADARRREAS
ncbi:MAG: hypothetical protein ACE5H5_01770 [Nitrospinota bacterium]